MTNQNTITAYDRFFAPLDEAFNSPEVKKRKCKVIKDWDHLKFGVERCLTFNESGRHWVQKLRDSFKLAALKVRGFFAALGSSRRLAVLQSASDALIRNYHLDVKYDPFDDIPELDKYAIYAGDGHYHEHATHDRKVDEKNYPVGHIFFTNLRTQMIRHLDVNRPEIKKEHEITALKRIGAKKLRMEEPKGRRVILVYDRACVDFAQWHKWKQASGIYIVTREKNGMNLLISGNNEYDKNDSRNYGVVSDQIAGTSKQTLVRRITYLDPLTNKEYVFITNVMDVPPGVIAFIYKMRWDIEKIFDEFKNKLHEKKAWATSNEAKCQQAVLMCITHNLLTIFERMIEEEEGLIDKKVIKRRENRKAEEKKKIIAEDAQLLNLIERFKRAKEKDEGQIDRNVIEERERKLKEEIDKSIAEKINSLAMRVGRATQRSVQFIRSIQTAFEKMTSWRPFIQQLAPYMEKYMT